MKIEKIDRILDPQKQNELWLFYHDLFASLNEETPLAQSLDRPRFISWMKSVRAAKFVATDDDGKLAGLAIISSDLRHDPLISIPYFKKHFPGKKILHIPVIAVPREMARQRIYAGLMRELMAEFPLTTLNAIAIFFHSETANPLMPRLVERCLAPKIKCETLDSMGCVALHMIS